MGNMFLDLRGFRSIWGSLLGLAVVAFPVATSQIGARDHRDLLEAPGSALPEGRIMLGTWYWEQWSTSLPGSHIPGCSFS